MDIKQIQELVKLVNKSNIGELSIEQKDFKITIKQKEEPTPVFAAGAPVLSQVVPQALPPVPASQPATSQPSQKEPSGNEATNYITIKSPMIGTFYRQAGPGKPVYVSVGDTIEKGQIVCMIEAMKLFNEIESEFSGTIVKVLVEDATPVEYDQPLFLVEP